MSQNWIAPKSYLAQNGIKITVGETLDPTQIGMPEHPLYGVLPTLVVTEIKADGSLLHGEITCECGSVREIGAGDWFQVRRCEDCQKVAQRSARKPVISADEQARREAAKLAKAQAREAKQAEAKLAREAKQAEAKLAREAKKVEQLAAKKAKLEAVAAEMRTTVSAKANVG